MMTQTFTHPSILLLNPSPYTLLLLLLIPLHTHTHTQYKTMSFSSFLPLSILFSFVINWYVFEMQWTTYFSKASTTTTRTQRPSALLHKKRSECVGKHYCLSHKNILSIFIDMVFFNVCDWCVVVVPFSLCDDDEDNDDDDDVLL